MTKQYMKKYSTSLATKEIQMKAMLRFLLTPVRMPTIKNINNNKCWPGCGNITTVKKSMEVPQKTENRTSI
jgi:hypothetical protein